MSSLKSTMFEQLCEIEPRLRDLEMEAKRFKGGKNFCANKVWYEAGGIKSRMCLLVGLEGRCLSKNETLCSTEAYEIVCEHLWSLLPDCGHGSFCMF